MVVKSDRWCPGRMVVPRKNGGAQEKWWCEVVGGAQEGWWCMGVVVGGNGGGNGISSGYGGSNGISSGAGGNGGGGVIWWVCPGEVVTWCRV